VSSAHRPPRAALCAGADRATPHTRAGGRTRGSEPEGRRDRRLFHLRAPDGRTLELPVHVVVTRGGTAPGLEVTEGDCAALEQVERDNGGVIPLTPEEWRALVSGDTNALLALAASGASNLHRLFPWDDRRAAELYRQRKLFGTGN
jgi:hypothetical protein